MDSFIVFTGGQQQQEKEEEEEEEEVGTCTYAPHKYQQSS
jgi:hypothetical protein